MPTNKNAQMRYKILDKCFRNSGRRYFIKDLIAECNKKMSEIDPKFKGISREQIYADIRFMESSEGWEIDLQRLKEGRRVYFRYTDMKFSIYNKTPLNEIEFNRFITALQTFTQFKGMPQFEWMQELLPKLIQGNTVVEVPTIMEFEHNPDLKGIEHIGTLYDAIIYKKVLNINYLQSFKDSVQLTIHPYYLKQYNTRWFLFGYNPDKDKYDWNLPLDRIIEINEIHKAFIPNTEIEWDAYFDDIIGVSKDENLSIEQITLHFIGKTAHYIETNPIHSYQKHRWLDSQTLEVDLELYINYELERLILSYAESVKVIRPHFLIERIKERMEKGISQYESQTIYFQ